MFHDQHVSTHAMYLPICLFLCPAQNLLWVMGISNVGSFPVQSGGSLIFFQLLGVGI